MWQFQAFGVQVVVERRGAAPDGQTAIFAVADKRMTQEGKVQPDLVCTPGEGPGAYQRGIVQPSNNAKVCAH